MRYYFVTHHGVENLYRWEDSMWIWAADGSGSYCQLVCRVYENVRMRDGIRVTEYPIPFDQPGFFKEQIQKPRTQF